MHQRSKSPHESCPVFLNNSWKLQLGFAEIGKNVSAFESILAINSEKWK